MPNRLLREGINDSESVNALSWPAEVFYRRLMSAVDDFGRFDGRPAVLRSRLYPLKIEQVREADISRWIAECVKAGLIALYAFESRPYLLLHKFNQQVRAKESKFPPPPKGVGDTPPSCAADAQHVLSTCIADAKHMRSETETETETETTGDESPGTPSCPEPAKPPASGPPFPCVGKGPKEWFLTPEKIAEWSAAFPGVDVPAELRKARQWLIDNPDRRKTFRGMTRFIGSWLERSQNRGRSGGGNGIYRPKTKGQLQDEYFADMAADAFGLPREGESQ